MRTSWHWQFFLFKNSNNYMRLCIVFGLVLFIRNALIVLSSICTTHIWARVWMWASANAPSWSEKERCYTFNDTLHRVSWHMWYGTVAVLILPAKCVQKHILIALKRMACQCNTVSCKCVHTTQLPFHFPFVRALVLCLVSWFSYWTNE